MDKSPVGLDQSVLLPMDTLQAFLVYWMNEEGFTVNVPAERYVEEFLNALMDQYFVDASGRKLQDFLTRHPELTQAATDARGAFQRLLQRTIGPLIPSYRYRYEIVGTTLKLTPSLPTLTDYEERMAALADVEDGWVPPRYR